MSSGGASGARDGGIDSLPGLLLQRLRVGLWICLLIYLLFGLFVLGDGDLPSTIRLQVGVLRGGCVAAFAAALAALRRPPAQRQALPIGVAAIALVAVSSGVSGVLIPRATSSCRCRSWSCRCSPRRCCRGAGGRRR